MEYLESRRYMLHRDLASRNFLVTEEFCVKLADFGRARFVSDDNYQAPRSEKICIKWSAPEVLVDSIYSTKSDVWAIGVLLWEIFSRGERPYATLSGEQTAVYVVEGGRLSRPSGCPRDLFSIMKDCWKRKPQDRPTFQQLVSALQSKTNIYYVRKPHADKRQMGTRPPNLKITDGSSQSTGSTKKTVSKSSGTPKKSKLDLEVTNEEMNSKVPVTTSSSETSLTSFGDIGRGDKIRKSLRKLMNIKANSKQYKIDKTTRVGVEATEMNETFRYT